MQPDNLSPKPDGNENARSQTIQLGADELTAFWRALMVPPGSQAADPGVERGLQPSPAAQLAGVRDPGGALSELLWVNRDRFLEGKPVRGLRQVNICSTSEQENRKLSTLRKEAGQTQTQLVNKIKHILRRHNLQWELPTKTFPTVKAIAWLREICLSEIDRLEMNFLLADLAQIQERLLELEKPSSPSAGVTIPMPSF